ncbi:uncharacterized protein LOC144466898 [Epinephelus lanceolatus]
MATNAGDGASEQLLNHLLERLRSRLEHIVERMPLDLDFLEFTCTQELVFLNAVSSQVTVCQAVLDALTQLHSLINLEKDKREQHIAVVQFEQGPAGRQRMTISPDYLSKLLELNLSVPCIAKLFGVSRRTVYRRMAESDLSVKALYSPMTDDELDQCVREIKSRQPNSGYRMMKGLLQARGLRVQYNRVRASMHRVDTIGVINRMVHVGCLARRTYSVPGPQALWHIDMNHKLIRESAQRKRSYRISSEKLSERGLIGEPAPTGGVELGDLAGIPAPLPTLQSQTGMSAEELRLTLRIKEVEVRHRELEVEAMHLKLAVMRSPSAEALSPKCSRCNPIAATGDTEKRECFYCHEQGHFIAVCPSLKRKEQSKNVKTPSPIGFIHTNDWVGVVFVAALPVAVGCDTSQCA